MCNLCMVSYLTGKETISDNIAAIGTFLSDNFAGFKCVIYADQALSLPAGLPFSVECISLPGTKHKRMDHLLRNVPAKYVISVDNDITGNFLEIHTFVKTVTERNMDVGWGRIFSKAGHDVFSKMVSIDKILSHCYIRPLLWKLRIGITIPGQLFMFKQSEFQNCFNCRDSFLDDLVMGLYINRNIATLNVLHYRGTLGYEMPKNTFAGLWRQRHRWAKGYSTILKTLLKANRMREVGLLFIHGFSYHCLWLVGILLSAELFSRFNGIYLASFVVLVALLLTNFKPKLVVRGILYQLFFPVFHLRWMYCLLTETIK